MKYWPLGPGTTVIGALKIGVWLVGSPAPDEKNWPPAAAARGRSWLVLEPGKMWPGTAVEAEWPSTVSFFADLCIFWEGFCRNSADSNQIHQNLL